MKWPADHSKISRTRQLIALETHQGVFGWVLERLAEAGLLKGQMIRRGRDHGKPAGKSAVRPAKPLAVNPRRKVARNRWGRVSDRI